MLMRWALAALSVLFMAAPSTGLAQSDQCVQLVDFPSAYGLPKGVYSLGMRIVPAGGVIAGVKVGITDYLLLGVSYGAGNVVGSGEPDWDDRIEFDIKLRFADEAAAIPALAIGFDSRGYGRQLDDGEYEKTSAGFHISAAKTMPFSEYYTLHAGLSRTLDREKAKPDIIIGASVQLSQEFTVILEYEWGLERDSDEPTGTSGYLNLGLRWVFANQIEVDLYFRNLVGPSGSPELNSRAIGFVFYDSF
ncbi:YjbH domain-containing protein [bacterium]|nr:YjbH domain-containing protein [bacterium]